MKTPRKIFSKIIGFLKPIDKYNVEIVEHTNLRELQVLWEQIYTDKYVLIEPIYCKWSWLRMTWVFAFEVYRQCD